MTREERQKANRTDRRKGKESDRIMRDTIRALGAGDVDHWPDDTEGNATPVSGENGAGE